MGGRGSSAQGSQGIRMPSAQTAVPQTRTQQLMAQVAANPAVLASMSDTDAQAVVQAVAQLPIAHDGTQEDSFVQRWLNHIGYATGKPRVLNERAFNAAARNSGAEVLYHSDNDYGNTSSATFTQQLLTGATMYAAGGYYGDGTYWARDAVDSARNYGYINGTQIKGFISKTRGRIANQNAAFNAVNDFRRHHPNTWTWLQQNAKTKSSYGASDSVQTVALTAAGYNARDMGSYKVTFDRSALTLCSKTRKARGITSNW